MYGLFQGDKSSWMSPIDRNHHAAGRMLSSLPKCNDIKIESRVVFQMLFLIQIEFNEMKQIFIDLMQTIYYTLDRLLNFVDQISTVCLWDKVMYKIEKRFIFLSVRLRPQSQRSLECFLCKNVVEKQKLLTRKALLYILFAEQRRISADYGRLRWCF